MVTGACPFTSSDNNWVPVSSSILMSAMDWSAAELASSWLSLCSEESSLSLTFSRRASHHSHFRGTFNFNVLH